MLDELHLKIMDTRCQDTFATECKREELKSELNLIDENDHGIIDHRCLKKIHNAMILHGKEIVTSHPSEKVLRK